MANSFEIKYIYDIFPDIDFTQDFVVCQNIVEKEPFLEIQATEDKWGHILDSIKWNRKIQSIKYRQYEVKIELSRNLDISILRRADYVSLTTTEGETFNVFDVQITYTKISGSRNFLIELTFKRGAEINNHLDSANCLLYKTAESATVNELEIRIDKPPFSFYQHTFGNNTTYLTFTISLGHKDFNLLYDNVSIGQYFYLHSDNFSFENIGIYECYVLNHTPINIQFKTNVTSPISVAPGKISITLDYEPDYQTSVNVDTSDFMTYNLYTFLQPEFNKVIEKIEGSKAPDGIQENQKIISKDSIDFKIWVTDSELWKIEYLNYSNQDNIELFLRDYDSIKPNLIKDINTISKGNNNLLNLHEFDIKILYNNKVVSYNR